MPEQRHGVRLTNLDEPLFASAGAAKRDLVDYLDAVAEVFLPELADRPLSVIRVTGGQAPFMQKNLPRYAPDWIRTAPMWAHSSHREVRYPCCDDRATLLWFANQRAVEYHPTLVPLQRWHTPQHLVIDVDPPADDTFGLAVRAAFAVRAALREAGLECAVKTSGAKGLHVFAPVAPPVEHEQVAAATRAIAARAERLEPGLATTAYIRDDRGGKVFLDSTRSGANTLVAAYSPRAREGVPVSYPVAWDDLGEVTPAAFTVHNVAGLLAGADPWRELMPARAALDPGLVEEGRAIPVARVAAMHEGKRRAQAARRQDGAG